MSDDPVSVLTLHLPQARKEAVEAKLAELRFGTYQQLAEACVSLLLAENAAFLALVGGAAATGEAPQMSWTEPGKESDDE
jgi:hypothetical protein